MGDQYCGAGDREPRRQLGESRQLGHNWRVLRLAPRARFSLDNDVRQKRQRYEQAQLDAEGGVSDIDRRRGREKQKSSEDRYAKSYPVPNEQCIRELRGRLT